MTCTLRDALAAQRFCASKGCRDFPNIYYGKLESYGKLLCQFHRLPFQSTAKKKKKIHTPFFFLK